MTTLVLYDTNGDAHIIDLKDEANIYLTKQFASINDFSIQGGYSQAFRIPMTERNATFFSPLWNPNNLTFDFGQKITAELQVETLQLEKGYLQVQKVYSKGDMWHEIDAQFFSTIPNLSAELKDKKLKDIEDLPNLNHDMIFDNVNDPFSNGVLLYGLTDKGQKWSENVDDIADGARSLNSATSPVYVGELTPFVQSSYLFNEILGDAGFTYESSVLDGLLSNYYVPFVNSKFSITEENPDNVGFGIFNASDYSFTATSGGQAFSLNLANGFDETYDYGSNVSSGQFTAPYYAEYTFRFKCTFKKVVIPATFSTIPFLRLYDQSTGLPLFPVNFAGTSMLVTTQNTFFTFEFVRTYQLNVGQTIELAFVTQGNSVTGDYVIQADSGWELVTTSVPIQGGTMDVAKNAPDIKQVDFIRDIIKMHNLVIIPSTNDANHLLIEPMTTYLGSGNTIDWTKKLDLTKDVVLYSQKLEQSKTFKWSYSAGTEYLSKLFVNAGRIYGDYVINVVNNDFATGENNVQLTMQSTPLNEINDTNIPIPKFLDEKSEFVVPGARILYLTTSAYNITLFDEVALAGDTKDVKLFSHYSELIPSVADYDLNFAPETPLQIIDANPYNNLWNLYWRKYYNELYGDESRTMEAYFLLDYIDYYNIKFSDVIYIKDSYWRLIDIENFCIDKRMAVKCKLMKYSSTYVEEFGLVPYELTAERQVLFSDGVKHDYDGNQGVCELYSYNWNNTESKCYAIGIVTTRPTQVTITK